ncbi:YgaP family membrane protein [Desulfosudis oleivorans]|uniref:Inner membrane protein YgaP-like transmembrane domain-containing protein n=1 Tax=Desulfosudis oleivorans (strain DSM 6200 / JCM 39069 / Hxd3) TaxID=96561 RepID=A8ZZA8_DESOH|nr:DUF2892 domain-containing protein [Desulfosudis oleivorans]ABW67261.1 conserved hypothetical protein [Desulfosudis oleivorans Hxd3]
MQVNEGTIDRIVRAILGILIIALFLTGRLPGYWALLLIFSGTFLMTAVTGYCPLYAPLGISTVKK